MSHSEEFLPISPDTEPDQQAGNDLAHFALQQEFTLQGDYQRLDEPNRGFHIDRLENQETKHPVPVGEAFIWKDDEAFTHEFVRQYTSGETPIEVVADAWSSVQRGNSGFIVHFPVEASKYDEAVAAGAVQPDLFDPSGKVSYLKPGAEELDRLVGDDQKRTSVEEWYRKQPGAVRNHYVNELGGVDPKPETLEEVSEAYDLTDGGKTIRLINFSLTLISNEQLRQATNAVRALSDKTGGAVFDQVYTVAILPKNHPSLQYEASLPDGSKKQVRLNGYRAPHFLSLSEWILYPEDEQPPRSEEAIKYYESLRLPGEPTEGPGSPKDKVSSGHEGWEATWAHELTHDAVPDTIQRSNLGLSGVPPTLLGRKLTGEEHLAELSAAEHMGGEDIAAVPEEQREALQGVWQRLRGSKDGGLTYERPIGPHFVVCKELDLTKGPLPIRQKNPERPLPVEITYKLVPDA